MYQAGELDQEINLYRWVYADDGQGGKEKQLSIIDECEPAKQRPLSGAEADRYDKLNAQGVTVFIIRNRDDLKESDLIEWCDKKFNIRYIKDRGLRNSFLEIHCEYGWPN